MRSSNSSRRACRRLLCSLRLAIAHGSGATLTDVDGRTYLDLNAGVSVASLGHAHPGYVAALTKQLESVSVGSFTSAPRAELVRLIAELVPGELSRTQFFSGGAEAVEAGIRLARSLRSEPTSSDSPAVSMAKQRASFRSRTSIGKHLSDRCRRDITRAVRGSDAIRRLARGMSPAIDQAIAAVIEEEIAGRPAAIVIEPIQGTAGNIVPPPGFLRDVSARLPMNTARS